MSYRARRYLVSEGKVKTEKIDVGISIQRPNHPYLHRARSLERRVAPHSPRDLEQERKSAARVANSENGLTSLRGVTYHRTVTRDAIVSRRASPYSANSRPLVSGDSETRSDEDHLAGIEECYNLADALAVATYLNVFKRYCRIVGIANLAQLVNAIAPIFTNRQGLFLQTICHPLRLYAEHTRELALDVHVDCATYDLPPSREEGGFGRRFHIAYLGPFKLLDAAATCDPAGREVTLTAVNRDKDREHPAAIQLAGASTLAGVSVAEVNGPGPDAMNSFDHPDTVGVREHEAVASGSRYDYVFPAHSITVLRLALA